jgi:site-specific recombinase XerD
VSTVEPIRDVKKIDAIKRILKKESPRNYLLFTLGINTGLKVSDLLRLKVSDVVDSKNRVKDFLMVTDRRNGQGKKFILNQVVKGAVNDYLESVRGVKMDQFLFASRKGENQPISRIQAWQVLNDAAQRVGIISPIGTHTLRKTFGYHAYRQGTDVAHLQKIFNHLAPSITLRYIGVTEDEIDQVQINLNL